MGRRFGSASNHPFAGSKNMKNIYGISGSNGPIVMVVAKGELLIVTGEPVPMSAYAVASITFISSTCTHVRMDMDVLVVLRGHVRDSAVCRELVMAKAHEPIDEVVLREELSQHGVRFDDVPESDILPFGNRAETCVTTVRYVN